MGFWVWGLGLKGERGSRCGERAKQRKVWEAAKTSRLTRKSGRDEPRKDLGSVMFSAVKCKVCHLREPEKGKCNHVLRLKPRSRSPCYLSRACLLASSYSYGEGAGLIPPGLSLCLCLSHRIALPKALCSELRCCSLRVTEGDCRTSGVQRFEFRFCDLRVRSIQLLHESLDMANWQ